ARRANERVGVLDHAVENRVGRGDGAPGGKERDFVGAAAEGRALSSVAAALVAHRAYGLHVGGRMEPLHLLRGGSARLELDEVVEQPGDFEKVLEAPFGFRVLEMFPGLDPFALARPEALRPAGVVPEIEFVGDDASGHATP